MDHCGSRQGCERTWLLLVSKIQFYPTFLGDVGQHQLIIEINWMPLFSLYSVCILVFGLPVLFTGFEIDRRKAPSNFDICDSLSQ